MIDGAATGCLDTETLAAFVEGTLSRQEIPAVLAHLEGCATCTHALETANAMRPPEQRRGMPWLAIAAAVLIAAVAVTAVVYLRTPPGDRTAALVALAPRGQRIVEARLTGGFGWAPYRGPMRAPDAGLDSDQLKLAGGAGAILDEASRDSSADAQRAAGAALLLIERPLDAATRLRAAAERAPNDAQLWSDLAAAEYATGVRLDRASRFPDALAACDRALRIRDDLPEALFNRALTLERLGLPAQARQAWQRYLAVDPSSPWASEAREHLTKLPTTTGDQLFQRDQLRLETAALAGDRATVAALVQRYPQQARTFAEAEYLGRWGEAIRRGDSAEAQRMLAIARAIGDALVSTSGEALLAAAVHAIDSQSDPAALANAHVVYRRGRIAYSRHAPAEGERDLVEAASLFGEEPMSLVARYYAANTRFDQNDVTGARRALDALRVEADSRPQFAALGAQIRWELGLCLMQDDDWAGAIPILLDAERAFRRLGERANLAFVEVLLADAYQCIGRPDDGWASRIRAFETLSAENLADRLPAALSGAVFVELRGGRLDAGRALLRMEKGMLRETRDGVLLMLTLVRGAVLDAELGDARAAWANIAEADKVASTLGDPALRTRAVADVAFAKGAVLLPSDARQSRRFLSDAIDGYVSAEAPPFLAECYLMRARAALQTGDREAARRDLEEGMNVYERHRIRFAESVAGTGVRDAGPELYRQSIGLAVDRGDAAAAFQSAERFFAQIASVRGAAPPTLGEMQRRLAGTGAMVLELVILSHEVVGLSITADDAAVHRTPLAGQSLRPFDEAKLYDALIQPASAQLARAKRLIVVADPLLNGVPFAALYDAPAKRRLVERLPVAIAPSAGALRRAADSRPHRSLIAVGLDASENGTAAALPAASAEILEIESLYPHARTIPDATFSAVVDAAAHADVLHVAGHTERQDRTGDAVLVFRNRERVSWRQAASVSIQGAPVVVLAACETLRAPQVALARSLSLGEGFLAAGAGDVIGTLAPIADNDARTIFGSVHRHLAEGRDAAEALRLAQLESIAAEAVGRAPAWRNVAIVTTQL